ncbi:hypothetical protein HU200_014454 [Digitaria exilis]|uniref:BZIP domain-containing protein n=1 Tax=Digitaria exilis TaxID=1010633 RepID=A0A835KLI8_9POAL|nr:hypothetical protein HU200_014454 [Digitaria exilis]
MRTAHQWKLVGQPTGDRLQLPSNARYPDPTSPSPSQPHLTFPHPPRHHRKTTRGPALTPPLTEPWTARLPPPAPSSSSSHHLRSPPGAGAPPARPLGDLHPPPDADLLLDPDADFGFSDVDYFPSLSDDSPSLSTDPTPRRRGWKEALAGHKRSGSVDGYSSSLEGESAPPGVLPDYAKKAVPAEKLAELALLDPKRAKSCRDLSFEGPLLSNLSCDSRLKLRFHTLFAGSWRTGKSAARSKERKIKYTGELERKVQTLQTEGNHALSTAQRLLQVKE